MQSTFWQYYWKSQWPTVTTSTVQFTTDGKLNRRMNANIGRILFAILFRHRFELNMAYTKHAKCDRDSLNIFIAIVLLFTLGRFCFGWYPSAVMWHVALTWLLRMFWLKAKTTTTDKHQLSLSRPSPTRCRINVCNCWRNSYHDIGIQSRFSISNRDLKFVVCALSPFLSCLQLMYTAKSMLLCSNACEILN